MTTKEPTREEVLATYGTDDFDELTTVQAIRRYQKAEDDYNRCLREGLDPGEHVWMMARLQAKIDRDYEFDR
ncbi:hypothetical protein [Nocardia neocaledoniensis]|uniref:hypothetical protein n=1 Tax=Nocardia neocaledoniensis TaxID=236511 RepID=UPI0024545533|nr:hypothetical protein [Nocardia neocaledoniensis]